MLPTILSWTLRVGLGSVFLLALPVLASVLTDASVGQADAKSGLLDINTATTDQPRCLR